MFSGSEASAQGRQPGKSESCGSPSKAEKIGGAGDFGSPPSSQLRNREGQIGGFHGFATDFVAAE